MMSDSVHVSTPIPASSSPRDLALAMLDAELQQLRSQPDLPPAAVASLARLASLCSAARDGVDQGLQQLLCTDDGLKGLLRLLRRAGQASLPAGHIAALLRPLRRQLARAGDKISRLL